ncbi:MAG: shikimate kinase [Desulfobacterales bacterium]|nr:shikimate kinase [Desulfobacterales bacterium]
MNIVLIGYRGTGKSVVAGLLAERLNMKTICMDAELVKKAGITIPEIVERYGWEKFRDMESQLARELALFNDIIIDTGGGIIERAENIEALRTDSLIFWLKASVDVIVSRIESDTERPALTAGKTFTEEVADVLAQRTDKYAGAADYEIDTDQMSPARVADEIVEIWKNVMISRF